MELGEKNQRARGEGQRFLDWFEIGSQVLRIKSRSVSRQPEVALKLREIVARIGAKASAER